MTMNQDMARAVVAVYSEEIFQGSAFFLSEKHILTARHVVISERTQEWKPSLTLGMLLDTDPIEIAPEHIQLHPDPNTDVAIIKLAHGQHGQPTSSWLIFVKGIFPNPCGFMHF